MRVAGLDDEVEVLRDRWGIPHISARTAHDLYFANGLVHGEDRLWQMELHRRAAHGRLSEVFGTATLDADRYLRRVGLARSARAELDLLDDESRAVLEAYSAGVNWAMEARPLPVEFVLLRHTPEPWTPFDTLAWAKLMGWGLAVNWGAELARLRLVRHLGAEVAAELEPLYPLGGWLIGEGAHLDRADARVVESYQQTHELLGLGGLAGGSNAWAIAPARSESGGALLAADLHLAPQMPSVWYELSLLCGDNHVVGVGLPGTPGIVNGHNGHIAWGTPASLVDTQDLFMERVHPDDPTRFARGDGWEQAEVVREEIRVKGQPRWQVEDVLVSSNGPVVGRLDDGTPLSLRASGLEPARTISAGIRLNRARDWDEFRAALADWGMPSLSFVYADARGNIGYQMAGLVPKRNAGDGALPAPGWDPAYAWRGHIPLEELPHAFNPPEGFVAAANNQPVGPDYPYAIGGDWCDAYRVGRIVELLRERPKHDVESCQRIQLDVKTNAGLELIAHVKRILGDEEPLDPIERDALRLLYAWDGRLEPSSVAAAIYQCTRSKVLRFLYAPALGAQLDVYLGASVEAMTASTFMWRTSSFLNTALGQPEWPERRGHVGLSWRDVLVIGLGEGVTELRLKFGDDPSAWQYGRLHHVSFDHPLGRVKPLRPFFNRGPYEIGGDGDTPMQTGVAPWDVAANTGVIPTIRQVVDFGDLRRSVAMHTTGQSGQPTSPHYDDMIEPWRRGQYHPLLWDGGDVEAALVDETRLIPTDELWPKP